MTQKTIKIYTLYRSLNFGAFLQAYALQKFLQTHHYNSTFAAIQPYSFKKMIKYILRKDFRKIPINIMQCQKYKKSWPKLNIDENFESSADICIVGSDELWNIKNHTFEHLSEYFGRNIDSNHVIAYAPSCNETTYSELQKFDSTVNFKEFQFITVRDLNTQKLVKQASGRTPEIVLDPTFLLDDYRDIEEKVQIMEKYILIYGYKFQKDEVKKIKQFAKSKKLKLISVGMPQMWCDKQIAATPFEFLSYIKNAEYVITGTFHGTIFSILYHKEFASYVNKKPKLENLLSDFELLNRDASIGKSLDEIFSTPINYTCVDAIRKVKREKSIELLLNAIELNNKR